MEHDTSAGKSFIDALLASLPATGRGVCVALSGGADSGSLLAVASSARAQFCGPLRAVHVNHELQEDAIAFEGHCVALCRRFDVPLTTLRVHVEVGRGESLEASAREARYAALALHLHADECLLTAHHAQDQAETYLLQSLRGAGLAGIAAMPQSRRLGAGWHVRPFLQCARAELRAVGSDCGILPIDDRMNRELRFERAYVRAAVWPAIAARWPAAAANLSRTAAHAAQASAALETNTLSVLEQVRDGDSLSIGRLRRYAQPAQFDALRAFIREAGEQVPSERRLREMVRQMLAAGPHRAPAIECGKIVLRRFRDRIFASIPRTAPGVRSWAWRRENADWGVPFGKLCMRETRQQLKLSQLCEVLEVKGGVPKASVDGGALRFERWAAAHHMRPWMREILPRVYSEGELIAVGDVWIDECWRARGAEPSVGIESEYAPLLF